MKFNVGDVVEVLGHKSQYPFYNDWSGLTPELKKGFAYGEEAEKGDRCVVRTVAPHDRFALNTLCSIQSINTNKVYIYSSYTDDLKLTKLSNKKALKKEKILNDYLKMKGGK